MLFSCGTSMKGKIEERNGKIYLINTSQNKAYQFTVKKTSVVNDSIAADNTLLILLAPGDEKYIADKKTIIQSYLPYDDSKSKHFVVDTTHFDIPNERIQEFLTDFPNSSRVFDTLKDEHGNPVLKVTATQVDCKITGQLEVTTAKYLTEKKPQ